MTEAYAIIGGGPAGLATARAFRRDDIPYVLYERHEDVGGMWDIDNPGTPIYRSTHMISSRSLSSLEGLPLPDDYPDYPSHDQLLAYLRDFARRYGVYDHARFRVAVERVEPVEGGWDLTLSDGEAVRHRGVVLASGSQWTPNLPEYPGEWAGEAFHSKHYRDPSQLAGRRVLVVGAGNSGVDIACDAARAAERAAISTRRGYWIVPKHLFGMPADVFKATGPELPGPVRQRVFQTLLRTLVGDLTRYGWPEPDHPILSTHPILNSEVIDRLAHGDLVHRPDVDVLEGDTVRFVDGRRERYDTIVWATGYRVDWPYLDRTLLPWPHPNDPGLFLNVFPPDHDDLFALGYVETDAGAWPHISLQANLIAQVILDQRDDPVQAEAFRRLKRQQFDLEGGIEHVASDRHAYYVQDETYRRVGREILYALQTGELATLDPELLGAPRWRRVASRVRARLAG